MFFLFPSTAVVCEDRQVGSVSNVDNDVGASARDEWARHYLYIRCVITPQQPIIKVVGVNCGGGGVGVSSGASGENKEPIKTQCFNGLWLFCRWCRWCKSGAITQYSSLNRFTIKRYVVNIKKY